MKLKLYPPFVVLPFIALIILSAYYLLPPIQLFSFTTIIGSFIIVFALIIFIEASRSIKKHKTTIFPDGVPTFLVQEGIFKFSRNPIYLAMMILMIGISVVCQNIAGLVFPVIFYSWINNRWIFEEERNLKKAFGKKYLDYCTKVPRWFSLPFKK